MHGSPIIALDAFRALAREGKAPQGAALRKAYAADSVKAEGGGTYTFTISTGAIDRDRDTIAVTGWHVDNFLAAGGPVLYGHMSRDLPVGKAPWVKPQGGALKARVEFAPKDVYPFAGMVQGLVDFGALKATSVGFRPLAGKAAWNDERNGIDFMEQELLEFSIVPVPSNPEALLDAKAAGIDVSQLREWLVRTLDVVEPGAMIVPRQTAERALQIVAGEPATVALSSKLFDFAIAAAKRGRVLSAANEERLRTARGAGGDLCSALDEVLQQLEEPPAEEPKEPKSGPSHVVRLRPASPRVVASKDQLVSLVNNAMQNAVKDAVGTAISAARGRLD